MNKPQPATSNSIENEKKTTSPSGNPATASTVKNSSSRTEVRNSAVNPGTASISQSSADNKEVAAPAAKPAPAGPAKSTANNKEVTTPTSTPVNAGPAEAEKDVVIYRVQILANTKPVGSKNYTVDGKSYKSFEYLYKGGYRTTIGECQSLSEATTLQNTCRRNGYNQAFVVAFKNNVRSNDPALFKWLWEGTISESDPYRKLEIADFNLVHGNAVWDNDAVDLLKQFFITFSLLFVKTARILFDSRKSYGYSLIYLINSNIAIVSLNNFDTVLSLFIKFPRFWLTGQIRASTVLYKW